MIIEQVIDKAAGIVDKLVPDADAKRKAQHELAILRLEAEKEAIKGQLEANVASAKHPSVFVAGARPAVIWGLLAVVLYNYIGYNLLLYLALFFPELRADALPQPIGDTGDVFYLIAGLLGMGGWRTLDRARGKARNSLTEVVE